MEPLNRLVGRSWLLILLLVPATGWAQYITLKTVPIATEDQFLIFPSENQGMAGVSIALDDPLLDPFVNPGRGSLIRGARLSVTPSLYDVSGEAGSGRALPASVLFGGEVFGGVLLSMQQIEATPQFFQPIIVGPGGAEPLSQKSANNLYAFGMLGTRLPGTSTSVGASVFWAGLDAVQGVDQLYAGSQSINQTGHMLDVHLGLYGELSGERTYELLVLHNRVDMTHEVDYVDWVFVDPVRTVPPVPVEVVPEIRRETNLDRTNTWGLHFNYVQPLAAAGWRVGGILTSNWKSHPKIPNYEIQNIPRDPGNSYGMNFGLGVSRSLDKTTFGIDMIFEPIWSNTWAEAGEPITAASGRVIPKGGKTITNDFTFTNALIRTGFGYQDEVVGFQLGLQVRSIDYELKQVDIVEGSKRLQDESWTEWTPTWGLSLAFSDLELRYQGRVTTGTGLPGTAWDQAVSTRFAAAEAAGVSDFIVAPSGPLTLQEASVTAHQFSISIPIQ